MDQVYSEISLKTVEKFRLARYAMISPNPENDVMEYMERWAKNSGMHGGGLCQRGRYLYGCLCSG